MALDQGTTSSRCIIFDKLGNMVSVAQKEFTQFYPKPAWVEHDGKEIFQSILDVSRLALKHGRIDPKDIASIGITNQRETTLIWDKNGEPIYNAIVWQCRRTSDIIDKLVNDGYSDYIREKTGLVPDAYFSASKIKWLLDNVDGARERAENGELLFGTIDTWLIYNLTGGKVHATDYTNASRTMLFNIKELQWDDDLLKLFDIPKSLLPDVYPSSHVYGETMKKLFGNSIKIGGVAGDQQCALFGQCCFNKGDMKNTYGTGCFLLMNTGNKLVMSNNGLLTTIAASRDDDVNYCLEGSIFIGGAAIGWLKDELKVINSGRESEQFASEVNDCEGAYVVPAFTGLGAPYWSQHARGTIVGITRGFNKNHLIRATLESIAYETYDIVKAMEEDTKVKVKQLKVDGGASGNNLLMQFQADILNAKVYRPECIETTALGAAYLAGLAVGFYKDEEEIRYNWSINKSFSPLMKKNVREEKIKGWKRAVDTALYWANND